MDAPKVTFHESSPGIIKGVSVHRQEVTVGIETRFYDASNHLLCQFSVERTGIGLSKNVSFAYFIAHSQFIHRTHKHVFFPILPSMAVAHRHFGYRSTTHRNPYQERRSQIRNWKQYAASDIQESPELLEVANLLNPKRIQKIDCLHIACAILCKCEYFLTTDDGILKCGKEIDSIKIDDPIGFIKEILS